MNHQQIGVNGDFGPTNGTLRIDHSEVSHRNSDEIFMNEREYLLRKLRANYIIQLLTK